MNPAHKYVILLAEDDDDDYEFFKEDVEKFCRPCELIRARDGEEAAEFLAKNMPDVIFLDKQMPKKDGLEVLIEIRQNPRLSRIPVVILTDSPREDDLVKNAFRTATLRKPLDFRSERFKKICQDLGVDFLI